MMLSFGGLEESAARSRAWALASLTTAITSIGLISSGLAADLSAPAPVYTKAPVAVVTSWNGFYIGGNIGGISARASGTSDFLDTAASNNPQSNSLSSTNFLGGGQVGYNWQFDPRWVVGLEGDWDWTNTGYSFCRQTDITSAACTDNGDGFESIGSKAKWLATARARLGFTVSNFLFYGTGGAAWGRVETNLAQNCLVDGCGLNSSLPLAVSSTIDHTKAGWAAGLGVEAAIGTHWSVRGEWLHIDLGNVTDSLATVGNPGTQTTLWSRGERFDEFRVGVNYLFK